MSDKYLNTVEIFSTETITKNTNESSDAIDLNKYQPEGYFSLQVVLTGDGTGKFEYLVSNDGSNYLEPSGASDIATGHTKTSGPGGDGIDIYTFQPGVARFMKIKVTETGTANDVVVTITLLVQ